MTTYLYRGVDSQGRTRKGRIEVEDGADLEEILRAGGVWLVSARKTRDATPSSSQFRAGRRELVQFCTLMEFLTRVGVPLVQAMELAARDGEHRAWNALLIDLKQQLEGGATLAASMERHPKTFRPEVTHLIHAGESSGSLPESFGELRRHLEWQEQVAGEVRQATLYPITVLVAAAVFVAVIFTVVVPKFAALLALVKVPLPLPTLVIFTVSDGMRSVGTPGLAVLAGLLASLATLRSRSARFAIAIERLLLRLPVWGSLLQLLIAGRFARQLSVLYRNGVALLPALGLVRGLLGSRLAAEAVTRMIQRIESGGTLSESMSDSRIFPPLLVRLTRVGEQTGQLDVTLEKVATYYLEIVPTRIRRLLGLMEPALILGLVALVGFVALAVYLPILSLMQSLR